MDASYKAINKIVNQPIEIINYEINAISSQSDALGEARIRLKLGNREINTSGLIALCTALAFSIADYGAKEDSTGAKSSANTEVTSKSKGGKTACFFNRQDITACEP